MSLRTLLTLTEIIEVLMGSLKEPGRHGCVHIPHSVFLISTLQLFKTEVDVGK